MSPEAAILISQLLDLLEVRVSKLWLEVRSREPRLLSLVSRERCGDDEGVPDLPSVPRAFALRVLVVMVLGELQNVLLHDVHLRRRADFVLLLLRLLESFDVGAKYLFYLRQSQSLIVYDKIYAAQSILCSVLSML